MLNLFVALSSDGVQDEDRKHCNIAMTGHGV